MTLSLPVAAQTSPPEALISKNNAKFSIMIDNKNKNDASNNNNNNSNNSNNDDGEAHDVLS
jgi:hypothetical protein